MFYSSTFRTLDVVLHYHQFHICYLFPCQGKIFIGVNCDTKKKFAKVAKLSSVNPGKKRTYKCSCEGTLTTGEATMYCYMHFWECQS